MYGVLGGLLGSWLWYRISLSTASLLVGTLGIGLFLYYQQPQTAADEPQQSPTTHNNDNTLDDHKEYRDRPESQTICLQVVSPTDCTIDPSGNMLALGGAIMGWIDIAAAICATKHARKSCVTVAIDSVHFIRPVKVNNLVSLKATVIKAQTTSMEIGVVVQSQEKTSHAKSISCFAFLTFVALDSNMEKAKVPKLLPGSERSERLAATVLQARMSLQKLKKMFIEEINNAERWKELWNSHPAEYSRTFARQVTIASTTIQMTHVVQPQHTNTVGITFGGWILRWIEQAGSICADRHAGVPCVTVGLDEMTFKKKTKVGWLLHFKAQVNRVFGQSMEIQVTVNGQSRHEPEESLIATALLTYTTAGDNPIEIGVLPEGEAQEKEYYLAYRRRTLRLDAFKQAKSLEMELLF